MTVKPNSPEEEDPRRAIRRFNLIGLATVVLLIGGVGGWAATMQMSGAVIAYGNIIVKSNPKKVQHPTGGVVGEILITDGSRVTAGQTLIRLDDTVPRATVGVHRSQLDELMAREARLLAERDDADKIQFPEELTKRANEPSVAAAIAGELKLFESRRNGRVGQRAQLRERIAQANEEVRGLTAQHDAKAKEAKFIAEELSGVSDLYKQNLVTIVRLMQLQRDQARLEGERGQFIAEIARVRAKISETEIQILQLEREFRTEVLKELREGQGRIAELKERITAALDQLKRVELRAPVSGIVQQLTVHTVGGVIAPNETVMQIIPQEDELIVEARVSPTDIDQLAPGEPASIRIMAGNQRTTPNINGKLIHVAADLTREPQTQQAYYIVRASLDPDEIARLGELKLLPGMPVEIFIHAQSRTPLEYLLKPLQEQIARTFRER